MEPKKQRHEYITKNIKDFVPKAQLSVIANGMRGEEEDFFKEKLVEIDGIISKMPKTYETEGTKDKTVWLHYFTGGMDWYIVEKDAEPEQLQAYGYADLGYGPEAGYINIQELVDTKQVELDLHFTPEKWSVVKEGGKPVLAAASEVTPSPLAETDEQIADRLMVTNDEVWEELNISSGSQLYADKELQAKYVALLKERIPFQMLNMKIHDILQDNNSHSLNQFLYLAGYYGEKEQNEWLDFIINKQPNSRQYYLDPVLFGLSIPEPVVVPDVIAEISRIEAAAKDANKFEQEKLLGEYQEIVYNNPVHYTRYTEYVKNVIGKPSDYLQYLAEGASDIAVFHKNIVAQKLNIWNLIPEDFKSVPKVKPVEFKTLPSDKGLASIHSEFTGTDQTRPIFTATEFDDDGITSTDAHVLIFTHKRDAYENGTYCIAKDCFEQHGRGKVQIGKFPNYKAVIPDVTANSSVRINANAVMLYISTIKKLRLYNPVSKMIVISIDDVVIGFNADLFLEGVKAMLKMGHADITMSYSTPNRAILLFPTMDKNLVAEYKTDMVLVMPAKLGDEIIFPVFDLLTNCVTNQGADECLSDYETVQKFKQEIKRIESTAITAKEIKKSVRKVDVVSAVKALKLVIEDLSGKQRADVEKAILALEILSEDMPETLEQGGYILYQNNMVLEEIYK